MMPNKLFVFTFLLLHNRSIYFFLAPQQSFYFFLAPQQSFYADKFGHDHIEIIKDSNVVDPTKLDDEKVCEKFVKNNPLGWKKIFVQ